MSAIEVLQTLRASSGSRTTVGLDDETIERFLTRDPALGAAIEAASAAREALADTYGALFELDESALARSLQTDYVNFYSPETVNPYVPLAAKGPWIVTSHGAVLHDNGGYGMLGLGHAPQDVLAAMGAPHVMANIMTPSISQLRFIELLKAEIGQTRDDAPFSKFICMNSGSEAVTVACRISDINAMHHLEDEDDHTPRESKFLSMKGSFHGRTDRPSQASDSSRGTYREYLASHHERDNLITVPPNDVDALRAAFESASEGGVFIEMMLMEPVMGEGDPGLAITREFYDAARELTLAHGSLLLVDSIQAGLRGTGFLSIVDYPGFEDCVPPDMETYSKALNAGQYPLSVLACTDRAATLHVRGVYGNTMTTNPRALAVGCAVLERLTPALRENIRKRGLQLVEGLEALSDEFPGMITKVQGTGLLFSAEIRDDIRVIGFDGMESWLRRHGLGVIHGGTNSLRFTPHFALTGAEVDLILERVRAALNAFG